MKLSNQWGLPAPIVSAVQWYCRQPRLSCTALLDSPRAFWLKRRHWDDLEQDVVEMAWAMSGSSWHEVLSKHIDRHALVEEQFSLEINGKMVSGQCDLYDGKTATLWDFKECSIWKITIGDFYDWEFQLNLYAAMLAAYGFGVSALRICAKLRDWKKHDGGAPIRVIEIPLWNPGRAIGEASKLLDAIQAAESMADNDLPLCSDKYLWKKDTYAVKKTGRKTALRVLETEEEAQNWQASNGGDYVDHRQGEAKRCEYCACRLVCNQYKTMQDSIDIIQEDW